MMPHTDKGSKPINISSGDILIAAPVWQDEKYKRSVIIILEHNNEGTKGIIINKLSTLTINEALPEIPVPAPLYYGGPFNPEIISFIHTNAMFPESFSLGSKLYFDGSYEYLLESVRNKQMDMVHTRFFSGFVVWQQYQLENEIAENKWWCTRIHDIKEFFSHPEDTWTVSLLSNGHVYGLLRDVPDPHPN